MAFEIVQIQKDDESIRLYVEQVKNFRLLSLKTSPESFGSTYARESAFTDDTWYQRLKNPQAHTFIALQSNQIVSFIVLVGPLPRDVEELSPLDVHLIPLDSSAAPVNIPTTSHWRINGMFTLPDARGKGIAKAIIEAAKVFGSKEAAMAGKQLVVSIVVDKDNTPARSLYEKSGFVTIQEEIDPENGKGVLLMKYSPSS